MPEFGSNGAAKIVAVCWLIERFDKFGENREGNNGKRVELGKTLLRKR